VQTAAVVWERRGARCTVRVDGLVTEALVADLRRLSQDVDSTLLDLRGAYLRTDGAEALRRWHTAARGAVELVLPDTVATLLSPQAECPPEPDAPVDLPSVLAHEVRGPLSVAHLRLQTLAARLQARGLEEELSATRRALAGLDLVNRLLDTYLAASRPWRLRPVDLLAVCTEAAEDARQLVGRGQVSVATDPPGVRPWVEGEPQALRQLVWNLVRNGLEAEGGEVEVYLTLRAPEGTDTVELVVADTGPGFPPEVLQAPFRPHRSGKTGGMGIGLVLCQWIARRHGGEIGLGRGTPRGAVVRVSLPRCPVPP
jgi:signal transduction histidine kinase